MKVEGIVDLFQYIKLARLQRVNLVQTLVWCFVHAGLAFMHVHVCVWTGVVMHTHTLANWALSPSVTGSVHILP